jgi:hypothetical protein
MAVTKDEFTKQLQKTNPGLVSEKYLAQLTPTDKTKFRKVGFIAISKELDTGSFELPVHRKNKVRKCYY